MDLRLTLMLIVNTLTILMSLIAIYKSNEAIDSGMESIEKIMKHIEIKERIEEERIEEEQKEIKYEQAVKDILETLPKGSVEIINQPFSNKIIIQIHKNVFMEE